MREINDVSDDDDDYDTGCKHLKEEPCWPECVSFLQRINSRCCLAVLRQCTLQQYVDDLFNTILHYNASLPPVVKFLFDRFDSAARLHNISDPEVVHTWKSNRYLI